MVQDARAVDRYFRVCRRARVAGCRSRGSRPDVRTGDPGLIAWLRAYTRDRGPRAQVSFSAWTSTHVPSPRFRALPLSRRSARTTARGLRPAHAVQTIRAYGRAALVAAQSCERSDRDASATCARSASVPARDGDEFFDAAQRAVVAAPRPTTARCTTARRFWNLRDQQCSIRAGDPRPPRPGPISCVGAHSHVGDQTAATEIPAPASKRRPLPPGVPRDMIVVVFGTDHGSSPPRCWAIRWSHARRGASDATSGCVTQGVPSFLLHCAIGAQ